jgi:hypothetical protein
MRELLRTAVQVGSRLPTVVAAVLSLSACAASSAGSSGATTEAAAPSSSEPKSWPKRLEREATHNVVRMDRELDAANALHRVDEKIARTELDAAGFVFVESTAFSARAEGHGKRAESRARVQHGSIHPEVQKARRIISGARRTRRGFWA